MNAYTEAVTALETTIADRAAAGLRPRRNAKHSVTYSTADYKVTIVLRVSRDHSVRVLTSNQGGALNPIAIEGVEVADKWVDTYPAGDAEKAVAAYFTHYGIDPSTKRIND